MKNKVINDLHDSLVLTHNLDKGTVKDIMEQAQSIYAQGCSDGYQEALDDEFERENALDN